jgi:hypothetical protein
MEYCEVEDDLDDEDDDWAVRLDDAASLAASGTLTPGGTHRSRSGGETTVHFHIL